MSSTTTHKQHVQHFLSWKLRMVMGAAGSCSPWTSYGWSQSSMHKDCPEVCAALDAVRDACKHAETVIRRNLENIK